MKKRLRCIVLIFLICIGAGVTVVLVNRSADNDGEQYVGTVPIPKAISSAKLKSTRVVPTLDTPIEVGQNTIWCASFLAAWKALEDLAGEPILLDGSQAVSDSLNDANDPRQDVPEEALYVAAGWNHEGVVKRIQDDLKRMFPAKEAPTFPGIAEDSLVAYSYLEANVKFDLPYFQNRVPLTFTDSRGKKTRITSFGIRPEDDGAYYELREQPRLLFVNAADGEPAWGSRDLEFAIDLCSQSSPSQIVVACIRPETTLVAALERIRKEMDETDSLRQGRSRGLPATDVLLVPDLLFQISHRFRNLEGQLIKNRKFRGQPLNVAQQDITFRLDRSGVELKSEAKMVLAGGPTYFIVDRPFLIYMKKRDTAIPYFVMWVDNAELLCEW